MNQKAYFESRVMSIAFICSLLALAACGSTPAAETDAESDAAADVSTDTGACAKACLTPQGQEDLSLCGDMGKYDCVTGCCVAKFVCTVNSDCASRLGKPECADTRFSCVCDTNNGQCIQGQCLKDGDCASGQVCSQGGCIAAPAGSALHARLLRTAFVGKAGQSVDLAAELGAQALDAKGNVVATATFTFTVTGTGAPTAVAGKIALPDAAGDFTVTAKVDGGDGKDSNPAIVHDIGKAGAGVLRVAAFDEETLAPLTGKLVVVGQADAATPDTAVTVDLVNGQANIDKLIFPADVHVIAPNHAPVTVLGYKPEGATGDITLTAPLAAFADVALSDEGTLVMGKIVDDTGKKVHDGTKLINEDAITGGITYSGVGEASLGLTSLSFNNSLLSFSIDSILGPKVTRKFDKDAPTFLNPGAYNEVPGGVTFGLGKPVITKYLLTGTPGKHKLWTLAGHIELATLYAQIGKVFDAIDGGVDIGKIVSVLLPYLSTFYSQVVFDVDFGTTLTSPLHEVDLNPQFPLLIRTVITPPKLPSLGDGTYADLVFAIGGAALPSGDIVPLGLTAAADKNEKTDPSDGIVDGDPETPGDQATLTLSMAPLHSGLQFGTANHVIVSAAVVLQTKAAADGSAKAHQSGGSIQISDAGFAPATLTVGEFLPLPIGSVFDQPAGTLKVVEVAGADFYRATLQGPDGASWLVMLPKTAIGNAIKLPDIKALGADQDYRATASACNVGAYVLRTPLTVPALLNGTAMTDLLRNVRKTSFTDAKPPKP
jgi:hypothetical protein